MGVCLAAPAAASVPALDEGTLKHLAARADRVVENSEIAYRLSYWRSPEWTAQLIFPPLAPGGAGDPSGSVLSIPHARQYADAREVLHRRDGARFYHERKTTSGGAGVWRRAFDGQRTWTHEESARSGMFRAPLETDLLEVTPDRCGFGALLGDRALRDLLGDPALVVRAQPDSLLEATGLFEFEYALSGLHPRGSDEASVTWRHVGRVLIDAARSFTPVRIRNGYVEARAGGTEYWLEEIVVTALAPTPWGGWYVEQAVRTTYGAPTDLASLRRDGGLLRTVEVVAVESSRWNLALDDGAFRIPYPAGTWLLDSATRETFILEGYSETDLDAMLRRLGDTADRGTAAPTMQGRRPDAEDQCGPIALYLAAAILGKRTDLKNLAALAGSDSTGTSLLGLHRASSALGLRAAGVRMSAEELLSGMRGAILLVERHGVPHWVLAVPAGSDGVWLIDYPWDPAPLGLTELKALPWSGAALLFEDPVPDWVPAAKPRAHDRHGEIASHRPPSGAVAASLAFDTPSARIEAPSMDALVKHRFEFRNVAEDSVFIEDVVRSCECSDATISAASIAPGERGFVELGVRLEGETSREITADVHLSDPRQPPLRLTLVVALARPGSPELPVVELETGRIDLGHVDGREAVRAHVRVLQSRPDLAAFDLRGFAPRSAHISAREVPLESPGVRVGEPPVRTARAVEVSVLPGLPRGRFHEEIDVLTDAGPLPLRVTGIVTRGVRVDPPGLFFGWVRESERPTRSVVVSAPPGLSWRVAASSALGRSVKARLEGDPGSGRFELRAELARDAPAGLLTGTLTLSAGDLEVEIPLDAWVAP